LWFSSSGEKLLLAIFFKAINKPRHIKTPASRSFHSSCDHWG
jgi:hypothetical protein